MGRLERLKMQREQAKANQFGFKTFLAIFIIYNLITTPLIVFYGPFNQVRNMVVGTIVTSRHPQFLKLFYSEEKVRQLMRESGIELPDSGVDDSVLAFNASSDSRVEMIDIDEGSFKGKLLKIYNPRRVKVIATKDLYKAGEKTSDIAKRVGAVAAINGGGFDDPNGKGNGGFPQGITLHDGKVLTGSAVKGGMGIIGIDKNGRLVIGWYTLSQLKANNVTEAVSFGPQLIKSGRRMVRGNGGWGIAPRTAIGQTKDGTILFLVIDGRQVSSIGATLKDVQEIMLDYGAINAANLDGGSSTTMFYEGQIVNSPSNPFGERYVPTAFVVMPVGKEGR